MRLSIASRPARFAALAAVAARLFLGLTVDAPLTHNGAWLSALIGGQPVPDPPVVWRSIFVRLVCPL